MHDLPLITLLAAGFAAAWLFGLITHRLGLSPIVGYLVAGIAIGPYTPGLVADRDLAAQLAELGVILLMFGVGLHFHFDDLAAVRGIAVPGAIGQSLMATFASVALFSAFGWTAKEGLVLGLAMSVASTVVLLRVLMDNDALRTPAGHAAIGWLIVEDIFTVVVLVAIPAIAGASGAGLGPALGWAFVKLAALVAVAALAGSRVVPAILAWVARQRSQELFMLTTLMLSIALAAGASALFGASMALGAFLAGMVVAQSPASHQAAADLLPLRDAFAVLFFVAVGMLFDPRFVIEQPLLLAAGLSIVLLVKPLAALVIVAALGYPPKTALTVAVGLAQVGEFSFILSEVARQQGLLPGEAHHLLVACAIASITLNPMLFRLVDDAERAARSARWVWAALTWRGERVEAALEARARSIVETSGRPLAIVVGYGPAGRAVERLLQEGGLETIVVDTNLETVRERAAAGRAAIYGDASRREILQDAGVRRAKYLVVTLPHSTNRVPLVAAARALNPDLEIVVRTRYLRERDELVRAGANEVMAEEAEAAVALARSVLGASGADEVTIEREILRIRREFAGR